MTHCSVSAVRATRESAKRGDSDSASSAGLAPVHTTRVHTPAPQPLGGLSGHLTHLRVNLSALRCEPLLARYISWRGKYLLARYIEHLEFKKKKKNQILALVALPRMYMDHLSFE